SMFRPRLRLRQRRNEQNLAPCWRCCTKGLTTHSPGTFIAKAPRQLVSADGAQPVFRQWRKQGQPVSDGRRRYGKNLSTLKHLMCPTPAGAIRTRGPGRSLQLGRAYNVVDARLSREPALCAKTCHAPAELGFTSHRVVGV